jgi:hypothetical protein
MIWGAHASRVLVAVSHRNELPYVVCIHNSRGRS